MQGIEQDWAVLPLPKLEYDEVKVADLGVDSLSQRRQQSFFLSVGTFHPHIPWYVPERFYQLYDPKEWTNLADARSYQKIYDSVSK